MSAAAGSIGIHTICHAPGMADAVDPAFLPFDVTAEPQRARRETAHMLQFWRQGRHRAHQVSGLLSPKFSAKTGIDGSVFVGFIAANPGHDVWFINPYPHYYYLAYNIWEHGEIWHPGLCRRAARLFTAAGLAIDLDRFPRSSPGTLLFSNIWAGTTAFWDRFMSFVDHLAGHAEFEPALFDPVPYDNGTAVYYPFIFERLFTTFLVMQPDIRARYANFQMAHMMDMTGNLDRLLLREWAPLIDRWDATGSYTDDQRACFRAIQKLSVFGMHANNPAALRALLAL